MGLSSDSIRILRMVFIIGHVRRKKCSAYLKIEGGNIIEQKTDHNHEVPAEQHLVCQRISDAVKRKAIEDTNERPRKALRSSMTPEALETLTLKH